jgi:hypothetical protein
MAAFQTLLGLGLAAHLHPMNLFEAQRIFRSCPPKGDPNM